MVEVNNTHLHAAAEFLSEQKGEVSELLWRTAANIACHQHDSAVAERSAAVVWIKDRALRKQNGEFIVLQNIAVAIERGEHRLRKDG